eukprot:6905980-Prymnesium_polylepis.1
MPGRPVERNQHPKQPHTHTTRAPIRAHRCAPHLTDAMHADADRLRACNRSGARLRLPPLVRRRRGSCRIPEVERGLGATESGDRRD